VTREELERKVVELRARDDFAAALEEFAAWLREDERELLQEVLLAHGDYGYALRERIDEPWWSRLVPPILRQRPGGRKP
jgi:hypothetical protein